MLTLWLPLAASIVMMTLEPSTINIGLGRTTEPELALAAYGVAFSLALLIEAPIMMLLDASVARSANQEAFALVRRFTVALGLGVTVLGLIISLTPLYSLIVRDLMNIPADVALRARPTLQILSFWSFPIAWRRAHQGVLIRAGRTAAITAATGIRLVALAAGLFLGLLLLPERGAVVAGSAMVLSVTVEAFLITLATRRVLQDERFGTVDKQPLELRDLWRFYRPLLATTILRQSMRPMLNAGIAAALLPVASLAAWPVTWGLAILITGPAWSLQQLTTALVTDQTSYHRVRNFSLSLSILFTFLLAMVAFTPLYASVMAGVYNLSPELQTLARPATQVLVLLPLLMGIQSFLRGVLIRSGRTGKVRAAMTVNVVTLGATLILGTTVLAATGAMLAALATMTGNVAELVWLWRQNRR
jgi:Na+-driven multidrug efflux pump